MSGLKMPWILALAILSLAFTSDASGTKKPKLPSAVVVGNVYCHTCSENDLSNSNHFISGALVAIKCDDTNSNQRFRKEVKTNKYGEFKANLPFSVNKHVKKIKKCSVNLIQSNDANCAVPSTAAISSLHLKSRKSRTGVFSAGFFAFKPSKQPSLCNHKPNMINSLKSFDTDPSFPPPLRDPPSSIIPPIDNPGQFAPIPILPRLPPLPELPNLPPLFPPKKVTLPRKTNDLLNQKTFSLFPPLVPNPFQPPPAILPPVIPSPPPSIFPPFFPSPPPSIFPPILPTPPQPPPSIFPPFFPAPPVSPPSLFPPIPGFTPASPPPPPPRLFPPFPFIPPGFPGNPPAAATKSVSSKQTNQP